MARTRTDEGHDLTNLELNKLKRRINKVYSECGKDVGQMADEYFAKFKKRDEEMLKHLNAGDITKDQYKEWRLAQIGRGKYFETLRDKLAERMNSADEVAIKYVNETMPSVYSLNRNYAAYTIEYAGNDLNFALWDEATVKNLLVNEPDVMPHYPANRAINRGINLAYGKSQITKTVTSGILQGLSIPQMTKMLEERVPGIGKVSAVRAARTAVTAAENAGREDEYIQAQKQGIEMEQEWMCTRDERTRDSHAAMDGEHVKIGKRFSNGCRYPGDPQGKPREVYNCRCTLVAWFPELEKENNKRYKYSDWKEGKPYLRDQVGEKSTIDKNAIDEYTNGLNSYFNSGTINQVNTGGHRNENPLTEEQKKECIDFAKSLGMPEDQILISDALNTSYGSAFDMLYIGTDVYPSENGKAANDLLSNRASLAHEIVGHRQAKLNGLQQEIDVFEEAQASIRAARYAEGLTNEDRYMLLRDAIDRLHHNGYSVKDIKGKLNI